MLAHKLRKGRLLQQRRACPTWYQEQRNACEHEYAGTFLHDYGQVYQVVFEERRLRCPQVPASSPETSAEQTKSPLFAGFSSGRRDLNSEPLVDADDLGRGRQG